MKRIIFFICLTVSVLSCSATTAMAVESPCGHENPAWQACIKDDDCIVHTNACGFPAAYNKKFLVKIDKYHKCLGPMISCAVPPANPEKNKNRAVCKKSKCSLEKMN